MGIKSRPYNYVQAVLHVAEFVTGDRNNSRCRLSPGKLFTRSSGKCDGGGDTSN